jgi:hypothetical protein
LPASPAQAGRASRAARTAASTSCSFASATSLSVASVAGLTVVNRLLLVGSVNRPLMNSPYRSAMVGRTLSGAGA